MESPDYAMWIKLLGNKKYYQTDSWDSLREQRVQGLYRRIGFDGLDNWKTDYLDENRFRKDKKNNFFFKESQKSTREVFSHWIHQKLSLIKLDIRTKVIKVQKGHCC